MDLYVPAVDKMDHSSMGHSMHDMPHDMPHDTCSMNMLFTWDWKNTCVVFKWWHIRSLGSFVFSLIALIVISASYEFIKSGIERWETAHSNTLTGATTTSAVAIRQYKLKHSFLYGLQVGYSFMLMLVFMTYNGWIMLAVVIGAAIGNYIWGGVGRDSTRTLACH